MNTAIKSCPFSLIRIQEEGYEDWFSLFYQNVGTPHRLSPQESVDFQKMIDLWNTQRT